MVAAKFHQVIPGDAVGEAVETDILVIHHL